MASTASSLRLAPAVGAPPRDATAAPQERHLHGRITDFLLLGGASLLLFPLVVAIPDDSNKPLVAFVMLMLANVINHPHFAHSYQIFYRGFLGKLQNPEISRELRIRYAVSGIVVPIVLVAYFAVGVLTQNVRLVGLGANIMALFVGWHYVKQGYGMLMVDAALKRRFFGDAEKKLLLVNAYAVWGASWLVLNSAYTRKELWHLQYFTFAVPRPLLILAAVIVAATSLATIRMLWMKRQSGKKLPVTGLTAYAVTLYLWILFAKVDPLWLLVIPALHSIQYLTVVYRFQANRQAAKPQRFGSPIAATFNSFRVQLAAFAMLGVALGATLFWLAPNWLDATLSYDKQLFGPTLFLFMFWVTVNVHHYFIDSVMWRRENPETKQHLFG